MSGNKVVIAMVNDDASDENTPGRGTQQRHEKYSFQPDEPSVEMEQMFGCFPARSQRISTLEGDCWDLY